MKKKKQRRNIAIVATVVALLVLGGVFVFARHNSTTKTANKTVAEQAAQNADSASDARKSADTPAADPKTATSANPGGVGKPTLNKSSGNGPDHTVPGGAVINFICNSTVGTTCDIVLTNQSNPNNSIKLGGKAVASTYGQPAYASWDWTSTSGNWSIVARASNGSASSDSDSQELTVQ